MKTAAARRQTKSRPKHKHTKEYLKHYYPFIPLFISIGILITVVASPFINRDTHSVLAYSTKVAEPTLLSATNAERYKVGASALTINDRLQKAAQAKANDMVTRNYWSHVTPDGKQPWTFVSAANYDYKKAGENLAFGFDGSNEVIAGWMNSTTHRENMLDKAFTEVGFATANSANYTGKGPVTVVVAMYATPSPVKLATIGNSELLAPDEKGHVMGNNKIINRVEILTSSIWATYVIGIILGAAIMYILITHSRGVKKAFTKGERFVIKHPLFDSIVIGIISAAIILLQQSGYIF